ncbi:hypothetical protein N0V92_009171 [Colletotrichum tropicale]|nr:hypothetical protein N0V92_009171 [Colletotrichum tropicale]
MPADRAQGYGAHLAAILIAVYFLKFGQTLIDKPIEILFREITCNSHYNNPSTNLIRAFPYDDPLCRIEEIENIIERGKTISSVFEAIGANLAFKLFVGYSVDASYIAAMTGIALGITAIALCRFRFSKTYCTQAENYRSEEEANPDRRPPRVQVFSSLARFPSCCLLFIVAILPPMASLSMPSLASWMSRVFPVYETFLELPTPLYAFPTTALVVTSTMIPMLESNRARRHSTNPQRRAFPLFAPSFVSISIGTMLLVSSTDGNYKLLIGGLVFMGLGGGAVPLTLAMLVSLLGRRLRCCSLGRALGVIYTLQCVVRLVLGPILYALGKPGRLAMAQLFPQFIILLAVYAAFYSALRWWLKNSASTAQSSERDIQLEEMRREATPPVAPSAPPPAYSSLARQNGRI